MDEENRIVKEERGEKEKGNTIWVMPSGFQFVQQIMTHRPSLSEGSKANDHYYLVRLSILSC